MLNIAKRDEHDPARIKIVRVLHTFIWYLKEIACKGRAEITVHQPTALTLTSNQFVTFRMSPKHSTGKLLSNNRPGDSI